MIDGYDPSAFYMGSIFLFIVIMVFLAAIVLTRYFKERKESF
jgi:Mg2+ and Co2+ transporter CorA